MALVIQGLYIRLREIILVLIGKLVEKHSKVLDFQRNLHWPVHYMELEFIYFENYREKTQSLPSMSFISPEAAVTSQQRCIKALIAVCGQER